METQVITDFLVTAGVLLGVFFLAYSAIRHQGMLDTMKEIKEMIHGKVEEASIANGGKYANV